MVELADASDSKSEETQSRAGSIPASGTIKSTSYETKMRSMAPLFTTHAEPATLQIERGIVIGMGSMRFHRRDANGMGIAEYSLDINLKGTG